MKPRSKVTLRCLLCKGKRRRVFKGDPEGDDDPYKQLADHQQIEHQDELFEVVQVKVTKTIPIVTKTMHQYTCSQHGTIIVTPDYIGVMCPFCNEAPAYNGEVQVQFYKAYLPAMELKRMAEFYCEAQRRVFYVEKWNGAMCPYCSRPADFNGTAYIQVKKT